MALRPIWEHRGYHLHALTGVQAPQQLESGQPTHLVLAHRTSEIATQLRNTRGEDNFDRDQLATILECPALLGARQGPRHWPAVPPDRHS